MTKFSIRDIFTAVVVSGSACSILTILIARASYEPVVDSLLESVNSLEQSVDTCAAAAEECTQALRVEVLQRQPVHLLEKETVR